MIEYGVLETKKLKKIDDLENELNRLIKEGWKVKCSIRTRLILWREVEIK